MNYSALILNLVVCVLAFKSIGLIYAESTGGSEAEVPEHYYYEKGSKIRLSRGEVNYDLHQTSNEGPIVLCLHCFMGTITDCSSISRALAKEGFRSLRFDFYGHGLSDIKSIGKYTVDDYVEQAVEMLEKLGLYNITAVEEIEMHSEFFEPQLYIVGTSLGGFVGMRFSQKYPRHVNKLVLDAPPGLLKKKIGGILKYGIINYPLQLFANIYAPTWLCNKIMKPLTENVKSPKLDFRAKYYCKQIILTSLQLFLGTDMWSNTEIYHKFGQQSIDTLFFWGSEDKLCPLSSSIVILDEYVPNAKIIVYENCKHRCSRYCREQFVKDVIKYFKDESVGELQTVSYYYRSTELETHFNASRQTKDLQGIRGRDSSRLEPNDILQGSTCEQRSLEPIRLTSSAEEIYSEGGSTEDGECGSQ